MWRVTTNLGLALQDSGNNMKQSHQDDFEPWSLTTRVSKVSPIASVLNVTSWCAQQPWVSPSDGNCSWRVRVLKSKCVCLTLILLPLQLQVTSSLFSQTSFPQECLFRSILFSFIIFSSILFSFNYSLLIILFSSILFYSMLFYAILIYSILSYPILF